MSRRGRADQRPSPKGRGRRRLPPLGTARLALLASCLVLASCSGPEPQAGGAAPEESPSPPPPEEPISPPPAEAPISPPPAEASPSVGPEGAVEVIRDYYSAIAAREYPRAYAAWAEQGQASGKTLDAFAAGFAETAEVDVEVGTPGRVEGAAGSRYVRVPVVVRAVTVDGRHQRFEGVYTLRRSVVDGATPAQRLWHILSARIEAVR